MLPVGFDTETYNGRALLLCTPTETCVPKSRADVTAFLLRHPRLVCYNVTHDGQSLIAWLPRKYWRRLATLGRVETAEGLRVRWVPGKFIEWRKGRRGSVVLDALPYFQTSLAKAARKVLGEEKGDPGIEWREIPAVLRARDERFDKLVAYCRRDADLAGRLYAHVHGALSEIGAAPRRPVSPASWAGSVFRDAMRPLPWRLDKLGRRAYFGGRIEVYRRGKVRRVWKYDLRSAYPSEEAKLQSYDHCEQVVGANAPRDDAAYGLYRVRVSIPPHVSYPPVPLRRRDASIIFPCGEWTTWTDLHTARLLHERGWARRWYSSREWLPTERVEPFRAGIERLYKLRADPTLKQAAKLVMNALYGKLAERRSEWVVARTVGRYPVRWIGSTPYRQRRKPGRRANVLYSLHVTAAVRLKLFHALEAAGDSALFVHTDAIAASRPLDLDVGSRLGQWGVEAEGDPCIIIGSGVYGFPSEERGAWDWTTRGFGWRDLTPLLREHPSRRSFDLDELRGLSLQAAAVGRAPLWDYVNVLLEEGRRLDLGFDRKRVWPVESPTARSLLRGSHGSLPWYWHPKAARIEP